MKTIGTTIKKIAFLVLCSTSWFTHPLTIVFDQGDVLVETDGKAAFCMNKKAFVRYVLYVAVTNPSALLQLNHHIRYKVFYRYLNAIKPRTPDLVAAKDENGTLIPPIMCDWLQGTPGKEILNQLAQFNAENPTFFRSVAEQELVAALTTMTFTPKKFVATRRLITPMVDFAKECHRNGDTLYILSNWDRETLPLFAKQHNKFFNLFKGKIAISGTTGHLKPSPEAFKTLLDDHKLDPASTVFIDDQPENCETAEKLGMKAIICTGKNVDAVRQRYYHIRAQVTA